jgi:hypothetical protein
MLHDQADRESAAEGLLQLNVIMGALAPLAGSREGFDDVYKMLTRMMDGKKD